MLCEACQEAEATCKVSNVSDGVKHVQHLCEACADRREPPKPTIHAGLNEILQGLAEDPDRSRRCPQCNMDLRTFRRGGRLGCPHDYDFFSSELDELLDRIHGETQHTGKRPGDPSPAIRLERTRRELEVRLNQAVRDEAYEEAARLRDEIHQIEGEMDGA